MPLLEESLIFEITPQRIRGAANVSGKRDLSTAEAAAFLGLFRTELEDAQLKAFREVIDRHFGAK